jgi:hypothetical protein
LFACQKINNDLHPHTLKINIFLKSFLNFLNLSKIWNIRDLGFQSNARSTILCTLARLKPEVIKQALLGQPGRV